MTAEVKQNGIHNPDVAILRTDSIVVIVILVKTIKCNLLYNVKGLNVNTSLCFNIKGIMFAVSVDFGIWFVIEFLFFLFQNI